MGLFDQLAGSVLSSVTSEGQGGDLLQSVISLVQGNEGGLGGLVAKLAASGLGEQAASWVGSGENLPVSAEQLQAALGSGPIANIAAKLGFSSEQVSTQLAGLLPGVIDKLTPNGVIDSNSGDLLQQGISILGGFLNKP